MNFNETSRKNVTYDIKSDRKQSSAFSSNSIFRIKAWIFFEWNFNISLSLILFK